MSGSNPPRKTHSKSATQHAHLLQIEDLLRQNADLVQRNTELSETCVKLQGKLNELDKSLRSTNLTSLAERDEVSKLKIEVQSLTAAMARSVLKPPPAPAPIVLASSAKQPNALASVKSQSAQVVFTSAKPPSTPIALASSVKPPSTPIASRAVLSHPSSIGVLVAPGKNYSFNCSKCNCAVTLSSAMLAKWLDPEGRAIVNDHGTMKLPGKCEICKAATVSRSGGK